MAKLLLQPPAALVLIAARSALDPKPPLPVVSRNKLIRPRGSGLVWRRLTVVMMGPKDENEA